LQEVLRVPLVQQLALELQVQLQESMVELVPVPPEWNSLARTLHQR
jgi:hypothetical protein